MPQDSHYDKQVIRN